MTDNKLHVHSWLLCSPCECYLSRTEVSSNDNFTASALDGFYDNLEQEWGCSILWWCLAKKIERALRQIWFPTRIMPSAWWSWHSTGYQTAQMSNISTSWWDYVLRYLKDLLNNTNQVIEEKGRSHSLKEHYFQAKEHPTEKPDSSKLIFKYGLFFNTRH